MIIDRIAVGQRIRQLMRQNNWSQQELADRLGISQPAVSQYLSGRIPPPEVLYSLANLAGTTMEWLLTGQETPVTAVRESQPPYGRDAVLLHLWAQLPEALKGAFLNVLRQVAALSTGAGGENS